MVILPGLAGCEEDWDAVTARIGWPARYVEESLPGLLRDPSLAAVADAALAAAYRDGAAPWILVAHSMGAMPAEALARRRPDGLVGVVLLDPSAEPKPVRMWALLGVLLEPVGALADALPRRLRAWCGHLLRRGAIRFGARGSDPLRSEQVRAAYAAERVLGAAIRGYGRYYRWAVEVVGVRRRCGDPSPVPVRMLMAADSTGRVARAQRRLVETMSLDGRAEVVAGSRHMVQLDRPDAVSEAVTALWPAREVG